MGGAGLAHLEPLEPGQGPLPAAPGSVLIRLQGLGFLDPGWAVVSPSPAPLVHREALCQ